MRIDFPDKSYVEITHSAAPGKIFLAIGAKSMDNPLKTIVNSVEISQKELKDLISELILL